MHTSTANSEATTEDSSVRWRREQRYRELISQVGERHARCDFNGYVASTASQRKALEIVSAWPHSLRPPFLFICGGSGVGKTHLAVAAYRLLQSDNAPFFVSESTFLRSWRSHAAARVPFTGAEDLIDATILFIDDIGTGCYTDKSMELMFQVIDHRARYEQPTVFTSNLDLAGLEAVFGQKLLSRMVDRDIATVVKIEGENYRMRATA